MLGLKIVEISGDVEIVDINILDAADVICTTPEKFGKAYCSHKSLAFTVSGYSMH